LIEAFLSAAVLGLTAGLCPICLLFLSPVITYAASKSKELSGSIKAAVEFSIGVAIVFSPLGAVAPWAIGVLTWGNRAWAYFIAGLISILIGLWVFRLFKFPYRNICGRINVRSYGSNFFAYGLSYGLATFARGAPLLISTLTIVSAVGDAILGALALTVYAFCMGAPPLILISMVGLPRFQGFIAKFSRKLDNVSGTILVLIGLYYMWMWGSSVGA